MLVAASPRSTRCSITSCPRCPCSSPLTGATAVASTALAWLRGAKRPLKGWGLVVALTVHVVSGLVLAKAPASVYRSLLHAPAMVVWKLRLWGRMLLRPGAEGWARTARATTPDSVVPPGIEVPA